jgi:hypothetical protein
MHWNLGFITNRMGSLGMLADPLGRTRDWSGHRRRGRAAGDRLILVLSSFVERVTFHNEENGLCVLRVKAAGERDLPDACEAVSVGF